MSAVVFLMLAVAALLGMLILNRRLSFPLLMELGMFCVAIGLIAAADSLYTEMACTPFTLMVRWGIVATGFLLIMISVARNRAKGHRRVSDYRGIRPEELERVHGGKRD